MSYAYVSYYILDLILDLIGSGSINFDKNTNPESNHDKDPDNKHFYRSGSAALPL